MPLTPTSARKTSNSRRSPKQYVTGQDGRNGHNRSGEPISVQDRIRQWQAQGAANALPPDAVSVRSQPRSETPQTPIVSRPSSPEELQVRTTPRKVSANRASKGNREWIRENANKFLAAERMLRQEEKMLFSFSKAVKEESAPAEKPMERQPLEDETRVRIINSSRAEREERRRRRRDVRSQTPSVVQSPSDSTRVHVQVESHPISKALDERPTSARTSTVGNEYDHRPSSPGPRFACSEDEDDAVGEAEKQWKPSAYAATLGRAPQYPEDGDWPKGRKRNLLDKTRDAISGKNDLPPAISNRLPSIEAWLYDQPDPFVDDRDQGNMPAVTVPKPLKKRSRHRKTSESHTTPENPNQIWDSVGSRGREGEKKSSPTRPVDRTSQATAHEGGHGRRLFSFEILDQGQYKESSMNRSDNSEQEATSAVSIRRKARASRRQKRDRLDPRQSSAMPLTELAQPISRDIHQNLVSPSLDVTNDRDEVQDLCVQKRIKSGLGRRLTTHEDLLSELSLPKARKSARSVRGSRRRRGQQPTETLQELLKTIGQDEAKYSRELRTLVDGVTPVLLQSLLSKTDSVAAAGLFSESAHDDLNFTKPVIDMGIALERLKSLHGRIPLHNVESFLHWVQSTHKSYADYLKAWRLGFQGVIVNLAPLDPSHPTDEEHGMARDNDGDVVDTEGKKVDVAYLQKRPLVRLKKLAKDLGVIKEEMPDNALANKVAQEFADLTELAKRRHKEEQGRLEDETAAKIDTTRLRDLKTLGPSGSVTVDQTRKVRARDCFNMTIYHSTGQRMDCRIEIVLRDNHSASPPGGDVLICQIEDDDKWLLFPPVELGKVSARKGEWGNDMVIMVRGTAAIGQQWSELLVLVAEDQAAAAEWLNMLGSNPVPPKLSRLPSFLDRGLLEPNAMESLTTALSKTDISPLSKNNLENISSDADVPIGEPSVTGNHRRQQPKRGFLERALPKLNLGGGLQKKLPHDQYSTTGLSATQSPLPSAVHSSDRSTISEKSSLKPLPKLAPNSEPSRLTAECQLNHTPEPPRHQQYSPQKSHASNSSVETLLARPQTAPAAQQQQLQSGEPTSKHRLSQVDIENEKVPTVEQNGASIQRPHFHRVISSTPSDGFPSMPKLRSGSKAVLNSSNPLNESIRDQWSALSGYGNKSHSTQVTPVKNSTPNVFTETVPQLPGHTKRSIMPAVSSPSLDEAPIPPSHGTSMPLRSKAPAISASQPPLPPQHGRDKSLSSSPLRHEYEASTSGSNYDTDSDDSSDSTSDTSEELGSEIKDQAMPLVPIGGSTRRYSQGGEWVKSNRSPTSAPTLQPSDSASQGPYRRAPPPSVYPAEQTKRTIATVCSWSDSGIWVPVADEECSIVISPGLIQAFHMSAAHSQPTTRDEWQNPVKVDGLQEDYPLVEFELTPIVPLRRGTALDITIRSPPTANSTVGTTTNNIMFRSRTVAECGQLYNMINWARCNNPTYMALLRSRPREQPANFATNVQTAHSKSWFNRGSRLKTSYRAPSMPPSAMGHSVTSANSMSSAFSALRRFKKNSPFSMNRSSVIKKPGRGRAGASLYSSSTDTGTGSGSSTPAPSQAGIIPGPDGPNVPATSAEAASGGGMVNKMKVRLFFRRDQHWEQLGACDLTVLPATLTRNLDNAEATPPGSAVPSRRTSYVGQPQQRHYRLPSSSHTPHRIHGDGREKRILITKHNDPRAVIVDELLGESCFEKIMQTGVAIKVWKEHEEIQDQGGVTTGKERKYLMQFPTSAEATWVFNMCGTYRYGDAAAAT